MPSRPGQMQKALREQNLELPGFCASGLPKFPTPLTPVGRIADHEVKRSSDDTDLRMIRKPIPHIQMNARPNPKVLPLSLHLRINVQTEQPVGPSKTLLQSPYEKDPLTTCGIYDLYILRKGIPIVYLKHPPDEPDDLRRRKELPQLLAVLETPASPAGPRRPLPLSPNPLSLRTTPHLHIIITPGPLRALDCLLTSDL